jgi:sugar lactone lactonase YvrE
VRASGELALLVVNHGGRESVEIFEVHRPSDGGAPGLTWRGCAVAPDRAYLNDVVGMADGSFLVSHMFPRSTGLRSGVYMLLGMYLGMDTGYVLSWHPVAGFRQVFGTETAFPNGVEISADERSIFVASTLGAEVRRIARDTGELVGSVRVPRPDNLSWTDDGRLLVASHTASFSQMQACRGLEKGTCSAPFAIVAIAPESMAARTVFDGRGSPMGAGTVGVQVGEELFIGSFTGDRIVRVPFPSVDREAKTTP